MPNRGNEWDNTEQFDTTRETHGNRGRTFTTKNDLVVLKTFGCLLRECSV